MLTRRTLWPIPRRDGATTVASWTTLTFEEEKVSRGLLLLVLLRVHLVNTIVSHVACWGKYRGRKLVGSLRKVTSKLFRKEFIPVNRLCGLFALAWTEGCPSKTITRSAKYVAMMKSCSTMKAVFFAWRMNRLMTFAAMIRCSESKYAEGSSMR